MKYKLMSLDLPGSSITKYLVDGEFLTYHQVELKKLRHRDLSSHEDLGTIELPEGAIIVGIRSWWSEDSSEWNLVYLLPEGE